ncbi:SRPBCC family protein [Actinospongicola halichondriae]|uniref:SRPBCC family protein n=1 Tax=Actinospongicola halichondriae TaxID=3236844 RepID=UPI003D51C7CB
MTDITRTGVIPAELDAVWAVLTDFGAISTWAANVDHSCILSRPERADDDGSSLVVGLSRRVQVGRNVIVEKICAVEAPTSLAYDLHGLPPRLRTVRNRWELVADGRASTRASLTTTVEIGPRPPQRVAERVVCRVLSKQSDVMLAGLATHLEALRV